MTKSKARPPRPTTAGSSADDRPGSEQLGDVAAAIRKAVDLTVGPSASFAEREAAYLEISEKASRLAARRTGE